MKRKDSILRCVAQAVLVAALVAAAGPAGAKTLLTVTSYDMPNGDGTAGGGDFNYWDQNYSNCVAGDCTVDGLTGSHLSGGTGKLTDGIVPTHSFFGGDGFGAYVGWLESPTITFHLGSLQAISEVKLYVDNSPISGVSAPGPVIINGVSHSDPAWAGLSAPEMIDITGLALIASDIVVTLDRTNFWVFLSEAKIFGPGPAATPLPPAWPMMLAGLAGLGIFALRRRAVPAHAFAAA